MHGGPCTTAGRRRRRRRRAGLVATIVVVALAALVTPLAALLPGHTATAGGTVTADDLPDAYVGDVRVTHVGQVVAAGTAVAGGSCGFAGGGPVVRLESDGTVTLAVDAACTVSVAWLGREDTLPVSMGTRRKVLDATRTAGLASGLELPEAALLPATEPATAHQGSLIAAVSYGTPLPITEPIAHIGNELYQDHMEISFLRGDRTGRMTAVAVHPNGAYCLANGTGSTPVRPATGDVDPCWYNLPFTGPDYVRFVTGGTYRTRDALGTVVDERDIAGSWSIDRLQDAPRADCSWGIPRPGMYLSCRAHLRRTIGE